MLPLYFDFNNCISAQFHEGTTATHLLLVDRYSEQHLNPETTWASSLSNISFARMTNSTVLESQIDDSFGRFEQTSLVRSLELLVGRRRVGSIQRSVVCGGRIDNLELNSRVALTVGALCWSRGLVAALDRASSSGNVLSVNSAVKHFQTHDRLIEGYLVARLKNPDERELSSLFDLCMDDIV